MSISALEQIMRDNLDVSTKTALRYSKIVQDYLKKDDSTSMLVDHPLVTQQGKRTQDILFQFAAQLTTASNLRLDSLEFLQNFEPQVGEHINQDSITIAEGLITVHDHFYKKLKIFLPDENASLKLSPSLLQEAGEVAEVANAAKEAAMRLTQYTIHRPRWVPGFGISHEPLSV